MTFLDLHRDPHLLTLVNVWDVASARAVAAVPGTAAIATASHAIAAAWGYDDGERIPRELMLDVVGRIAASVPLPVTADLEAGYGDAAETVRRAIGLGVVGANIEDLMAPVPSAAAVVAAVMAAAEDEGVPDFVLNARTDAFLEAPSDADPDAVLADALARCSAYLDAGAPVVFLPGLVTDDGIAEAVSTLGRGRVTLLAVPGLPPPSRLEELGVARVSHGPYPHSATLTALSTFADSALARADSARS